MSSVNYNLGKKGVRLVSAEEAWVKGKNGKYRLNPKYSFVGKVDLNMPNMIVSTVRGQKPTYKGDINELNQTAKKQIVEHFYDDNGKRNKKTVAYFAIEKKDGK
ncbi:MAG: hypothetical protein HDT28_01935 [Clostridiales bacterium]|nr:hypothetical protein [Clostridiales bacterium]